MRKLLIELSNTAIRPLKWSVYTNRGLAAFAKERSK